MVCNRDCFNCPYDDCVVDEMTEADLLESIELDRSLFTQTKRRRKPATNQNGYSQAELEKRRAYARAYYHKNRHKFAERQKAYYAAHRDEILAKHKAYYQENRDEILVKNKAYLKEYYKANRERLSAKKKEYYLKNHSKIRAQQKSYREKRREQHESANT